ncbi:MAG: efflux RND transporter periplasmic adaptor subunit [Roseobacter sp.]
MAGAEKPKTMKRLLAWIGRSTLTLGVAAIAGVTVVTGVGVLGDRAAAVPDPQAAAPLPVHVQTLRITDGYSVPRRFVGQIEARATVSLSFELGGKIEALLIDEGDAVTQGEVIARLDTDLLDAEATQLHAGRAALAAQLVFAESRLTRAKELQKQGFTSQETLDEALAARDELTNRIAETDAALQAVNINLEKSVLRVPVSGRIAAQDADPGETVQAGQQIVIVMDMDYPELRVGLPLHIDASQLGDFRIEVADRHLNATLKRLRPDIDPVTRTRTAILTIEQDKDLLFGQSAALVMQVDVPVSGAWIPLDALQSGNGSVWTAMVVIEETARRIAVEIMHIDGPRAFVRGSFEDGDQLIALGAHRIVPGQTVSVIGVGS